MTTMATDLSYPVGRFDQHAPTTAESRRKASDDIASLPAKMRAAVAGLTDAQLDTPYRPGGWTVRQLVHHVADSHMNGYIRLKLALTEDNPTIKPYEQDKWALLPDSRLPIETSLKILDAVHEGWTTIWQSVTDRQLERTFMHPELGSLTLDTHLHLYGWHSRHHVAHITALREREGW
jgi:DinB superfamily